MKLPPVVFVGIGRDCAESSILKILALALTFDVRVCTGAAAGAGVGFEGATGAVINESNSSSGRSSARV